MRPPEGLSDEERRRIQHEVLMQLTIDKLPSDRFMGVAADRYLAAVHERMVEVQAERCRELGVEPLREWDE